MVSPSMEIRPSGGCNLLAGGSGALAAPDDESALEHDEDEQQHADHDLGPPRAQGALEGDDRLDQTEHEDAEHRSQHESAASGQERPADDHRRDGIQLHADTGQRRTGSGQHREEEPADPGTRPAEHQGLDHEHADQGPAEGNLPPANEVPPMTTARIASSSMNRPTLILAVVIGGTSLAGG